jgi:uncharacterized protein YbbC (DUF1343 family)
MIEFGIDRVLAQSPAWKNSRIALVTNHAATTNTLVPSRLALLQAGFRIEKLFSPEHGLDVKGADGHKMHDGIDAVTALPVVSLYSQKLAPTAEDLEEVDLVVFDIPDVGSRFYTYLWTMTHVMEACAAHGKKMIILDRPNPVSGRMDLAEGPTLEEAQASFIGRWPIPIRHSCTLGELAVYFNKEKKLGCDLDVIRCNGWDREMFQPDWGTTFVATSPAIRRFEAMLLYPGLCLLEATNLSEGRSTDFSFTAMGAPWMCGEELAQLLQQLGMDEIQPKPVSFVPNEGKYAGQRCNGIQFDIIDPVIFKPVYLGMLLVKMVKERYKEFNWGVYPTMVNPDGKHHLDKLLGIPNTEQLFDLPLNKFLAQTEKITSAGDWQKTIGDSLLY